MDEKRLIDANGKHTINAVDLTGFILCFSDGIISVVDRFGHVACEFYADDIPTVDAVEVVRCRDCKHYDNSEGICWCHLNSKFYPGGFDWHSFPEDGFCYYGERRSDD